MKSFIDAVIFGLIAKYINIFGIGESEKEGCIDIYLGREGHKRSAGFALTPAELARIRDDIDDAIRVFEEAKE